jgi:hypothetical protein
MASLKQGTSMSQQDRRVKFYRVHQDTQQKVRGLLNDEQRPSSTRCTPGTKAAWASTAARETRALRTGNDPAVSNFLANVETQHAASLPVLPHTTQEKARPILG